jgi:two-component system OmpR family response regulator
MSNSEHSRQPEDSGCVLVVDDNPDVRELLCVALQTAGFDVIPAGTQLELQRRLAEAQPDALVIDLQRSEADGLAVLSRMRARQSLHDVPILFLSGSDDVAFHWRAVSAGADWVGVRPLGMHELREQVTELVRNGRPRVRSGRRQRWRACLAQK